MAKKAATKKKTTKTKTKKTDPGSSPGTKGVEKDFYDDDEEPPYCLTVEYDGDLPEDDNDQEPNVVSASVRLSKSHVTMDKAEASGHSLMTTYVEFTLPEALLGKKLNPGQLKKFIAILNDEGRWSELIKELGE